MRKVFIVLAVLSLIGAGLFFLDVRQERQNVASERSRLGELEGRRREVDGMADPALRARGLGQLRDAVVRSEESIARYESGRNLSTGLAGGGVVLAAGFAFLARRKARAVAA